MALKDGAGLVKKYAMVNIQKYQWVAIGDTVKECEKNYITLLSTNGISDAATGEEAVITGNITAMASVVIDGNTHYYLIIDDEDVLYDVNLSNDSLALIIKYAVGDKITLKYSDVDGIKEVLSFE